jgi:hypothetical protein
MGRAELPHWISGLAPKWQSGLTQLLNAARYAQDSADHRWQFAINLETLLAAGLTENDLRWLNRKQYIDVATEIGSARFDRPRKFRSPSDRSALDHVCVILTDPGLDFAEQLSCTPALRQADRPSTDPAKTPASKKPRWDARARVLWLGSKLVKRLTVPAANQDLILTAFEERGWPTCIDDPLPPADDIDAKRRLHDTINRLNRSHTNHVIRFTGNGNGCGACWTRLKSDRAASTTSAPGRV